MIAIVIIIMFTLHLGHLPDPAVIVVGCGNCVDYYYNYPHYILCDSQNQSPEVCYDCILFHYYLVFHGIF